MLLCGQLTKGVEVHLKGKAEPSVILFVSLKVAFLIAVLPRSMRKGKEV